MSEFDCDDEKEEVKENFFQQEVDNKLIVTCKTTLNPLVVTAMKSLQAILIKMQIRFWKAKQEKAMREKLIFLL